MKNRHETGGEGPRCAKKRNLSIFIVKMIDKTPGIRKIMIDKC